MLEPALPPPPAAPLTNPDHPEGGALLAPVDLRVQSAVVDQWLRWLDDQVAMSLRSPATAQKYRQVIRYWLEFLERRERSDQPTPGSLDRYQQALASRLKPASANLYLEAVRSCYAFAERKDLYPNIARSLEVIRVRRDGPLAAFTESEVLAMVRASGGDKIHNLRNQVLVALLFGTAIRGSSLLGCNVGDYAPAQRTLRFRTKGARDASSSRQVPEGIAVHLDAYLAARAGAAGGELAPEDPLFAADNQAARGHRLTTAYLRRIVQEAVVAAGLTTTARGVHALRRAALVAVADDLGIEAAQEVAGHASVATTRAAYAGVRKAEVHRDAARRLDVRW